MKIELNCPSCAVHIAASPDTCADQIVDRMIEEGPWIALDKGATFEDMIFSALLSRGSIRCPECADDLVIQEESFGTRRPFAVPCC